MISFPPISGLGALALAGVLLFSCQLRLPDGSDGQVRFLPVHYSSQWRKGNTHTHTNRSDGDSSPATVADWYESADYDFLVLSDHNVYGAATAVGDLLIIAGEELTYEVGHDSLPVHVNALGTVSKTTGIPTLTVESTLQAAIHETRASGGVPQVNHPNFEWAFNEETLSKLTDYRLLEIWNGARSTNSFEPFWPSATTVWDKLLTSGHKIYALAVDDAHRFHSWGPDKSNPGRGWINVAADDLSSQAILAALENGEFYASTGIVLSSIVVTPSTVTVTIARQGDERTAISAVGDGQVLHTTESDTLRYELGNAVSYVRVEARNTIGQACWTQPFFTTLWKEQE